MEILFARSDVLLASGNGVMCLFRTPTAGMNLVTLPGGDKAQHGQFRMLFLPRRGTRRVERCAVCISVPEERQVQVYTHGGG